MLVRCSGLLTPTNLIKPEMHLSGFYFIYSPAKAQYLGYFCSL